ncbi:MAG: CPBP family intramembrane metalloprotease [Gammaproteobacteria bacterium]|nr:CPBP family intramembrane metalloprotease [Gammaproteobacteria bacterium]MDE0249258.1 CPBP family intramembrane metalloprotease [Gammaproteobacteria bacterium]
MTVEFTDGLPYLLLWTALGAAVFPDGRRVGATLIAFSLAAAVVAGIVTWAGFAVLALFSGACLAAVRPHFPAALRTLAWGTVLFLAVALATHQIPWIQNVLVLDSVSVSASAADYTLYWNYDKGFAGVVLYAVCVQPQPGTEWKRAILATATVAVLTMVVVGVLASAAEFVSWDPKWPAILAVWVPANLFLTCVAEETFFRGLVQRQLGGAFRGRLPAPALAALLVAAVAFGVAHVAGGTTYVLLATLAGVGYGAAYHLTGRLEASILVHFTLNLAHLILFTYPFAA